MAWNEPNLPRLWGIPSGGFWRRSQIHPASPPLPRRIIKGGPDDAATSHGLAGEAAWVVRPLPYPLPDAEGNRAVDVIGSPHSFCSVHTTSQQRYPRQGALP